MNTILSFGTKRGTRTTETGAVAQLLSLGYQRDKSKSRIINHVKRGGETLITEWWHPGTGLSARLRTHYDI